MLSELLSDTTPEMGPCRVKSKRLPATTEGSFTIRY